MLYFYNNIKIFVPFKKIACFSNWEHSGAFGAEALRHGLVQTNRITVVV